MTEDRSTNAGLRVPEILAPAGNAAKLLTAAHYGADAVYLGGKDLNLRAGASGFDGPELDQALELAHGKGVRVYYCLNAYPLERDLGRVRERLEGLSGKPLDGLIVADLGVAAMARRMLPGVPLHASTQANTANSETVLAWRDLGAKRVNLARECTARDMQAISRACPGVELEAFVHGAMCMAWSGRCWLSAHLNRRSANQGRCTHPCRFKYRIKGVALEEATRPGEILWQAYEQDGYTAYLAAEDLCLLPFMRFFLKIGLSALKIEGRTKSPAYLGPVVDAYKTAVKIAAKGPLRPGPFMRALSAIASRPLSTGLFMPGGRTWTSGEAPDYEVVGQVERGPESGSALVGVKRTWDQSRPARIMLPGMRSHHLRPGGYRLLDEYGFTVDPAHSGLRLHLEISDGPVESPGLEPGSLIVQNPAQ